MLQDLTPTYLFQWPQLTPIGNSAFPRPQCRSKCSLLQHFAADGTVVYVPIGNVPSFTLSQSVYFSVCSFLKFQSGATNSIATKAPTPHHIQSLEIAFHTVQHPQTL